MLIITNPSLLIIDVVLKPRPADTDRESPKGKIPRHDEIHSGRTRVCPCYTNKTRGKRSVPRLDRGRFKTPGRKSMPAMVVNSNDCQDQAPAAALPRAKAVSHLLPPEHAS